MTALSCSATAVDNRYPEPLDAFTRHLGQEFRVGGGRMFRDDVAAGSHC